MELSINDLLKGKATVIKDHEFLSTEAYVEPFLERMSKFTSDFRVQAKLPNQISLTKSEDQSMEDTVFNRVWIQAVMPEEYSFENHQEVVGLVYGLDAKKPVAKVYRGALNMACLNLCVFDPSFLDIQEVEPNKPLNFKCVNSLMEQVSDIKMWLDKLSNTEIPYDYEGINERLGMWVRNTLNSSYDNGYGKIKIATSVAIDALTFDDGPDEIMTPKVLDVLKQYNIKATFFLIGNKTVQHPQIVKRLIAEGHSIGNHTYSHKGIFPLSSAKVVETELRNCSDAIADISGVEPKLFRPPFGVTNPIIGRVVRCSGLNSIGWSIRSLDTLSRRSREDVCSKIIRQLHPGAIILLHDRCNDADVLLQMLIPRILEKGYTFTDINNLILND